MSETLTPQLYLTYTCPVSRFTYAGHPSHGTLHEHTNDLADAVGRIKGHASRYGQPVSWVINDQEYLNLEGLMPDFIRWQAEGDSILVTLELTTSPEGVDKTDTAAVLGWISERCQEAGFTPDGLWSLKFFESDLAAINTLSNDEYPWARNLAGSCWHQEGIDDSTWLGCPYNPYYPALWNSKAAAQPDEPQDFLMLEWLTRDITAILSGGFPATFSLDPADANRKDAAGFSTEQAALEYSNRLIDETARQVAFNPTVVVNINEEARHYQTEGHDKDLMLDGMFARFAGIRSSGLPGVEVYQAGYREVWSAFRQRHPVTPERIFVTSDLDPRDASQMTGPGAYAFKVAGDTAVLYEDAQVQMCFLRSKGALPVEFYNYADKAPGKDTNDPYPCTAVPQFHLRHLGFERLARGVDVNLAVFAPQPASDIGFMFWEVPVKGDEVLVSASPNVLCARATPAGLFVRLKDVDGHTEASVTMERSGG